MSVLKKLFAFAISVCLFSACSDGNDVESLSDVRRADVYLEISFPTGLNFKDVKLVTLNSDFEGIDTTDLDLDDSTNSLVNGKTYFLKSKFFPGYNFKLLLNAEGERQDVRMSFEYYIQIGTEGRIDVDFTLVEALAADRIKSYLQSGRSIEDARSMAVMEIESVMEMQHLDSLVDFNVSFDQAVMFLCRFIDSDTLFYSDFVELKNTLIQNSVDISEMKIRGADAVYQNFWKLKTGEARSEYLDWKHVLEPLMVGVYGISKKEKLGYGTSFIIEDSHSKFKGDSLIYDKYRANYENEGFRTLDSMELLLGLCSWDKYDTLALDGRLYVCAGGYGRNFVSPVSWHEFLDSTLTQEYLRDKTLSTLLGKCGKDVYKGTLRFYEDSLYLCTTLPDRRTYRWSSALVDIQSLYPNNKVFVGMRDSLTAYVDAYATRDHGVCNESKTGEKVAVEKMYAVCNLDVWKPISAEIFYTKDCSKDNVGEIVRVPLDSVVEYLKCMEVSPGYGVNTHDGYGWMQAEANEYYQDVCDSDHKMDIVEHDGEYFICTGTRFLGISKENILPPVLDRQECFYYTDWNFNRILKYDSSYYTCTKQGWQLTSQEEVPVPVLNGHFCETRNEGEVLKIDGKYYRCWYYYRWIEASSYDANMYEFNEKYKDYCANGVEGSAIVWSEALRGYYGCVKKDSVVTLTQLDFAGRDTHYMVENGAFVNDSIYRAEQGAYTFEFSVGKYTRDVYATKVYEGSASELNYKYDAYVDSANVFLHSIRGDDFVEIDGIPNKSESFGNFYTKWFAEVRNFADCIDGYSTTASNVDMKSFKVMWYNEDTFMTYDQAKSFCPEGYHIPDSTEFRTAVRIQMTSRVKSMRNDSPFEINYTLRTPTIGCSTSYSLLYSLFWTSTSKDEKTQYCLEYARTDLGSLKGYYIMECPKDLYPMVQTLCVKNI